VIRVEQGSDVFRIQHLGAGREAREVHEEDRDNLAFRV
jgi:hypothetical protein